MPEITTFTYFELYSENGFFDDRTKTLLRNTKDSIHLTLRSFKNHNIWHNVTEIQKIFGKVLEQIVPHLETAVFLTSCRISATIPLCYMQKR